ncbi:MAG: type II toxin-antitoxin system RelE/ParE family toxin [Fibromonadaceae bacterium]|jgi:plasmid stabilization system protein ParE|nr:type II toxin-antitoxin system RelE/ParE family toxin [Fibromonadaceae bacterium]
MINDDLERKPAIISEECLEMLQEAIIYLKETALAPDQAEIMKSQFFKMVRMLERMPGLGVIYKNGMRRFMLGKFRYQIYYKELEDEIEIVGIWHTSRGTEFEDR